MEVHRLGEADLADDERLTRFLLGELPEEEGERLQDACFEDEALFARLLRAEDDLIDAYVRGDLTAAERERFEQRFGQTRTQARRVKFASLLRRTVEERRAGADVRRSRGRMRAAVAAGLLAVVLGAWWWAGRGTGPRVVGVPTAPTTSPAPRLGSSPSPVPTEAAPVQEATHPSVAVAALTLSPGLVRGSGAVPRLVLSPTTTSVELRLDLGPGTAAGTYRRYEVIVQTAAGAEVFRRGVARGQTAVSARLISVTLPAKGLTNGDYVVLVNGRQADGTQDYLRGYSFRVVR
jgi:hypothetical protein